jgi:hypothetical protein
LGIHPPQTAIPVAILLPFLAIAVLTGLALWRHLQARQNRPRIEPSEVVYQEWFASGWSEANLLTKLGGAQNCLRLVVTREMLWITSWFPIAGLASRYDLEHVIPLQSITAVKLSRRLWTNRYLLSYADASGVEHTIGLVPKHPDQFLQALGRSPDG